MRSKLISCCLLDGIYLLRIVYIHIYIYIMIVLVVTKSLCGFVANQVQYNMESAQYLGQKPMKLSGRRQTSMPLNIKM